MGTLQRHHVHSPKVGRHTGTQPQTMSHWHPPLKNCRKAGAGVYIGYRVSAHLIHFHKFSPKKTFHATSSVFYMFYVSTSFIFYVLYPKLFVETYPIYFVDVYPKYFTVFCVLVFVSPFCPTDAKPPFFVMDVFNNKICLDTQMWFQAWWSSFRLWMDIFFHEVFEDVRYSQKKLLRFQLDCFHRSHFLDDCNSFFRALISRCVINGSQEADH